MYKQACRLKLRFDVVGAGRLSTEQLWSANVEGLITLEEELQEAVEKLGSTSRRKQTSQTKAGEELKLKLAIISDVLDTREKEATELRDAASKKAHEQKILSLIAEKREDKLKNMSEEELLALLN
jgi:hypothetical protein